MPITLSEQGRTALRTAAYGAVPPPSTPPDRSPEVTQNSTLNRELPMPKRSASPTESQWTGMVPVDDTALAVTDTGGPGVPVVHLNGQFATQGYWRHVIAELGTGWRHITYDERARGRRSKQSADYSFEAAVHDLDAVLAARGVTRVLVVGWSYGAFVGAHWAGRNPDRTLGAVLVDGAQPHDWLDGHGAADSQGVPANELVHAPAAPDGADPADDRRTDGGLQH
ncbi:alpha/beta fold hydrolase [Streptomyces sp. NPDC057682]|uniref:alpha/beta fold hydrolase n=1 Tax=Streptomyces sp. NPDC057682 TaxID=3346210 RepID=UPI0036B10B38